VYCILGDGEIQEGQVWEAAMTAPKLGQPDHPLGQPHRDRRLQQDPARRFTAKILDLEPLVAKWQAFGWPVQEIDGHDPAQIGKALDQAEATHGRRR
jgi:transketolase